MFRLRSWAKHQGAIINHVKSSRRTRGQESDTALVMQKFNVASSWDRDFLERFAPLVGHRNAEAFFVRVLQYVAKTDGMGGECRVPRDEFGPLVLTRQGDPVSRKTGQGCYDALLSSGLAVSLAAQNTGVNTGDALPVLSGPVRSPPVLSGPVLADTAGGSASPPGNDSPRISPNERAGVLAACSAILGQRDVDRDIRAKTKAIQGSLLATDPAACDAAEVAEFVRVVVYARAEARIAYLAARRA